MFGLSFGLESVISNVLHSDGKKIFKISHFLQCFQNFMINWENLIKNRESRRQHIKSGGLESLGEESLVPR